MIDISEADMAEEVHKDEDKSIMTELRKIADTIQENIKTETDYPSKQTALDIKVRNKSFWYCKKF